MVIFNSYVKLPEGKWIDDHPLLCFAFHGTCETTRPLEKPKSDKEHPFIASEEHNQTTADFGSHRSATG